MSDDAATIAELRAEVRRLRRQLAGMTKERDDQVRRKRTHIAIVHTARPVAVNAIAGPVVGNRGVR